MTKEKRMRMKKEKRRLRNKDKKRTTHKVENTSIKIVNHSEYIPLLDSEYGVLSLPLSYCETPKMGWKSYFERDGHQVNEVVNNGTFGCEVVNELLSTNQKKIIEKMGLDKVDILSVKRRYKGLTSSGISGECHSNVIKLVELFGGKQIVGYGVQTNTGYKDKKGFVSGNCVLFYCHSVWKTPDGEVIDPTESVNHHKYETTNFIPIFVYQEDGVWSIQMDLMFPDNFEDIGYILLGDIGHKEDMRLTFESLHHYSTFVTVKYTEEELKKHIFYERGGFTKPSISTGKTYDEMTS